MGALAARFLFFFRSFLSILRFSVISRFCLSKSPWRAPCTMCVRGDLSQTKNDWALKESDPGALGVRPRDDAPRPSPSGAAQLQLHFRAELRLYARCVCLRRCAHDGCALVVPCGSHGITMSGCGSVMQANDPCHPRPYAPSVAHGVPSVWHAWVGFSRATC